MNQKNLERDVIVKRINGIQAELAAIREFSTFVKIGIIVALLCIITIGYLSQNGYLAKLFGRPSANLSKVHEIKLTETGFVPDAITIAKGDTIIFTTDRGKPFWPASDLHPTHEIYPEFDPKTPIDPNTSWSFRFDKEGEWRFHDHLDPFFRGTIIVQ